MATPDAIAAILSRRSIRAYEPAPIPDEYLSAMLEAVRQAPSAANLQPLHFVVVRDPEQKRRVAEACRQQNWMASADVIVVAAGFPAQSSRWFAVDAAIALENLVVAATSLGYGTCWVGAFTEGQVKDVVGLPEEARVVAVVSVGRPAESPSARSRKDHEELFSMDRYGQKLPLGW